MRRIAENKLAALAAFVLFGLGAMKVARADSVNTLPPIFNKVGFDQHLRARIPSTLSFFDETGKKVALGEYLGDKPVVLGLVYYGCPNLCSLSIRGLLRSMAKNPLKLGVDYRTVLVSIDPKETPKYAAEQKARFLKEIPVKGAASGLTFLTGSEEASRKLAQVVGFGYQYDERTHQYAHAAGIMVLTPGGEISSYLFGIEFPVKDLKLALVDASGGKIGSPVDQFLLYCFHYDPVQGKYGLFILNLVRLMGAVTVLLIGGYIYFSTRSKRRKVLQVS